MFRAIAWCGLLTASVSYALPPEGFEKDFAVLNNGKVSDYFSTDFVYQSPAYRNDFESAQAIVGFKTGENLLSLGAKTMVAPFSGERSAYFGRYDLIFGKTNSFALKYIHEEWSYIASAKEVWAGDFNFFIPFGNKNSGLYVSFGYYYRWLKQRWNDDWGNALNYNTRDRESWFEGVMGFKIPFFSNANFMTFDLSWRDSFSYYNFDNMAFDFGFYFPGNTLLMKLNAGIRTSALTMGAGYASEYYGSLGFQFF